jgi:class 3 adenylate cyclase/tetratricopeptide (TPR) repeat protein
MNCPRCGEENPPRFRLCGFCGTPLGDSLPAQEARKTVTIVFCDLKGSTQLGERLDSESLGEVMNRYFDEMRFELEHHGGTIEKFIGDAVMAVFGLPRLHEDDALRAVRAAAGMQSALTSLNDELERRWGVRLENRIGVNTGEVVTADPGSLAQRLLVGDAVNVAARLEQAAGAMEVMLGEPTYRLVRDAVEVEPVEPLELKGKSQRVPAYRLVGLRAERERRAQAMPLVGRAEELGALEDELAASVESSSCRLVTVIGEPGLGKTRLTEEFMSRAEESALVLRGRCLPYGRGITFWPLVEIVRAAAGIREDDDASAARAKLRAVIGEGRDEVFERVSVAVGLDDHAFPVEELFWGARLMLESLGDSRALVLVFDDVHWAEQTFLDLVEHLRTAIRDRSVLILCLARDDFLEQFPDWDARGDRLLRLEPLGAEGTEAIAKAILGDGVVDARIRARVVEAAEGNPLFAEQLASMVLDEGASEHGAADVEALLGSSLPPTIHALLAARLDRLAKDERLMLEAASVVGLEFREDAVRHLVPEQIMDDVGTLIGSLERRRFVLRRPAAEGDGHSFRFSHMLVKDAVYQGILKRARAALHERFVEWADTVNRDRERAGEFQEILAYHLEQAFRYLGELGPVDEHGQQLGRRAAGLLATAGRRAFARGDMAAAANLLRRAVDLLPEQEEERLVLLVPLAEAFLETGELAWAQLYLDQAAEAPRARADPPFAAGIELMRALVLGSSGDDAASAKAVAVAACRAIDIFEPLADHEGLATAYRALAWAKGTETRFGEAAAAAQEAVVHAALAGDERQRSRGAAQYAIAALHGPTPVSEAMARCREIIGESGDDRRLRGLVTSLMAPLEAMQGDFEAARALVRQARATLEELGSSVLAASTSQESCVVEMLAGEPAEAETHLRRDYELLERMGERYLLSTIAGELARTLYAQARYEEALAMTETAERLSADDDIGSQALWRSVRARLVARSGDLTEGIALAEEAVRLLEPGDTLVRKADALVDLADVLRGAGLADEARHRLDEAVALLRAKGNMVALGSLIGHETAAEALGSVRTPS